MARKTKRAKLSLTNEQRAKLDQLSKSRKAPLREVQRAQVLLHYADETPISQIQQLVNVSRPTIYKCIEKALAAGADAGLKDFYHRPFEPTIDDAAKTWVVNLACTKPKDHGLAAELWTYSELADTPESMLRLQGTLACQKQQKQQSGEYCLQMKYGRTKSNITLSEEILILIEKCRMCSWFTKKLISKMIQSLSTILVQHDHRVR